MPSGIREALRDATHRRASIGCYCPAAHKGESPHHNLGKVTDDAYIAAVSLKIRGHGHTALNATGAQFRLHVPAIADTRCSGTQYLRASA